jgi:hypothetical protein
MMRESTIPQLLNAFGRLFCVAWIGAVLAFPSVKGIGAGYLPVAAGLVLGLAGLRFRVPVARLFEAPSPGRYLLCTVLVAALVRAVAIGYFPLEPMVDDAQFHRYAISMVNGQGYGAPEARAWFPPGASLVLAAWYTLTTPSPFAGKILHLLFACGLVWQTWELARRAFSERVARIAALLAAVFPTLVFYTATLGYETLLGLILVASCRLAVSAAESAEFPMLTLAVLGALLGAGALVKPICVLVPLVFGVAWLALGGRFLRVASRTAFVIVAMAVVIAPWTFRNYRILGAFVPISTNGGTTLYAANNPNAMGLAMTVEPLPGEVDEVSRDRLRMRAAISWMVHHPARWFELAVTKVVYTWGTSSSIMSVVSTDRLPPEAEAVCKAVLNVGWTALLVWCCAATLTGRPWTQAGLVPATLVIAYLFGIHLFYEAMSRHHVPVIPFLLIVGATALAAERR